jgi:hypothetical protein
MQIHNRTIPIVGPELLLLPLNGEGGTQMTPAKQEFAPHTQVCTGWQADSVEARLLSDGVSISVKGGYDLASGGYTLFIRDSGTVEVNYRFECLEEIEPRQFGLVFTLPEEFDTLTWRRRGLWSTYPGDHIGRLEGRAKAFPGTPVSGPAGPGSAPSWPWSLDSHALGSRDFRSTKATIEWAALTNHDGYGLAVLSGKGTGHIRCWVVGKTVHMLAAAYSNAGAERFYVRHARSGYRPLLPGSEVSGRFELRLGEFPNLNLR